MIEPKAPPGRSLFPSLASVHTSCGRVVCIGRRIQVESSFKLLSHGESASRTGDIMTSDVAASARPEETLVSMKSLVQFSSAVLGAACAALSASAAEPFQIVARSRVPEAPGSDQFKEVHTVSNLDPGKTAVVICDMWDRHWCQGATRRVAEMAPRMNEVVNAARSRGALIIHCPSGTLSFYENAPQRKLAQAAPPAPTKVPLQGWCSLDPPNPHPRNQGGRCHHRLGGGL
jgi:hypothetical protein